MGWQDLWEPTGDPLHLGIIADAFARCDYPWDRLQPGLRQQTGRERVPILWDDLSQWATGRNHHHDHERGFHAIEARSQVLGLAWYDGKVTLGLYVAQQPTLAAEVLLSEAAHMVDFFALTDPDRVAIWNAVHPVTEQLPSDTEVPDGLPVDHGHGWFDVGRYGEFVGEAWMGAFVEAFSDVPVTITLAHTTVPGARRNIRAALLPGETGGGRVYGVEGGAVYHDQHDGVNPEVTWPSAADAEADGRRPCRTCLPHYCS